MAKVALLIGVSGYGLGFNSLPGTLKDVDAMQRILQHPDLGGFTEVETLKNPDPLVMQIAIEALFKEKVREKDDIALLFFSGHCVNDHNSRLYFGTSITRKTAKGELLKSTALPASFIQDIMSESRSKRQVVILDCCFSNAFADVWSGRNYGFVDVKNQLGGEGRVILTSSTSTQHFFQHKGFSLSTYTRYLVEGIESGVADLDRDQRISVNDLQEYASRKARESASTMEPAIYADKLSNKILLAKTPICNPQLKERKNIRLQSLNAAVAASEIQTPAIPEHDFSVGQNSNPGLKQNIHSHAVLAVKNFRLLIGTAIIACVLTLTGATYGVRQWQDSQWLTTSEILDTETANAQIKPLFKHSNKHSKTIWSLAFSPKAQLLFSSSGDNTIKIWNLQTQKILRSLFGHSSTVWSIAVSPDGQTLVSSSGDKTIKIWNLQTGELLRTFSELSDPVLSLVISPDGQTLVGSGGKTIKIWNLRTGALRTTLAGHTDQVRAIALSPDGKTLASGGGDTTIKIWNLQTGELLRTLYGHKSRIIALAISPDGQSLASGSNDKTIELWNLQTGVPLRTLVGHGDHVNSLAFSADGQFLVSGAEDHLVKLWNPQTGEMLRSLSGHTEDVYAVAISPDGKTVASGDKDGQIKIWR